MKIKLLLSTISVLSGFISIFYIISAWYQIVIKDSDISVLFNNFNNPLLMIVLLMFIQRMTLDLRIRLDRKNDKKL